MTLGPTTLGRPPVLSDPRTEGSMISTDAVYTNGRWTLPPHARGVRMVPIEHRDNARNVPVVVRSNGLIRRRFAAFFSRERRTA